MLIEVPTGVLPTGFDGAFVEDESSALRWLSSNTAKFAQSGGAPGTEAWSVLSSSAFGKRHKAPQEFLEGSAKETEVVGLLLDAVEQATGISWQLASRRPRHQAPALGRGPSDQPLGAQGRCGVRLGRG